MSTKIHNGYRLPRIKTIKDLMGWWHRLSDKFEPLCLIEVRREITKAATWAADIHALMEAGTRGFNIPAEWSGKTALQIGYDQTKDKKVLEAMRLEISILHSGTETLCLLHTQKEWVYSFFRKESGAVPYPYWDNTDKPDNVSDKLWAKREQDWDQAVTKRTGVPGVEGAVLRSDDPALLLWDVRKGPPKQETRAVRAKRLALDILSHEALKGKKITGFSMVIEAMEKARKSPKLGKKILEVQKILKPHGTWASLDEVRMP